MTASPAVVVAGLCLVVQLITATWFVPSFNTPNFSTEIAASLLATGRLEGGQTKVRGPSVPNSAYRRYHLPVEPLYLAGALRFLPPRLHRYIHVPVTVLLVTSVAYVAFYLGGPSLGLVTGLVGSLQPFVALHGPVWDDCFLGAAFAWSVLALLASRWKNSGTGPAPFRTGLLLALASGAAALTRQECLLVLALTAASTFALPALSRLRREACWVAGGLVVALAAWGARNYLVTGEFAVGASRDGITLWEWNGPVTQPTLGGGSPEGLSSDPSIMSVHWSRTAAMTEGQANRYYLRQTLLYALRHPGEAATTSLLKLARSWTGVTAPPPLTSLRNAVALSANLLLFGLAFAGLCLLRAIPDRNHRRAAMCLVTIILGVGLITLSVGPVGLRYRILADGVLWIAASAAVLRWTRPRVS
jgi:hypothetical protein